MHRLPKSHHPSACASERTKLPVWLCTEQDLTPLSSIPVLVTGFVGDREPGPEEHAAAVVWQTVDHLEFIQALGQVAHAPIDLAQFLLAIDVFGVLGAVTLGRGRGQGADETNMRTWGQVLFRAREITLLTTESCKPKCSPTSRMLNPPDA